VIQPTGGQIEMGVILAADGTRQLAIRIGGQLIGLAPGEAVTFGLQILARARELFDSPEELDAAVLAASQRSGITPAMPGDKAPVQ
jgi:hypothetical protein